VAAPSHAILDSPLHHIGNKQGALHNCMRFE
jgi:hypothetical protein